jgi:Leucine-rich repeat (LRR) protein
MKKIKTLLLLFICYLTTNADDFSHLGSKLNYSDSLKNAKKITSIDKALKDPSKVINLELFIDQTGANYKKFCTNITKFTNLRKLYIVDYYAIDLELPSGLWDLTKLEYLSLDNFKNKKVDGISKLTELKYLSLDEFNFTSIPEEIFQLKNLVILDLSMNLVKELPPSLASLTNLRELELTNNCFTEIPANITILPALEYLTINNADFSGFLKPEMNTCENTISRFPDVLAQMSNMKHVACFYGVKCDKNLKKQIHEKYKNITFDK